LNKKGTNGVGNRYLVGGLKYQTGTTRVQKRNPKQGDETSPQVALGVKKSKKKSSPDPLRRKDYEEGGQGKL